MISLFKLACQDCGLTMSEATAFLGVRDGTAKDWWLGRRTPKESVIDELIELSVRQDVAAREAVIVIEQQVKERGEPEQIELGIASDDHEAQSLGWPCVGAHAAVLRRVLKILPKNLALKITIVPRGSTVASAAAIGAHE